jgi:hypothetical protein
MRNPIDNPMGRYAQVAKQLESPAVKLDTLARYAQGQNPAVPEFLALAEIKRRQSLNQHSAAPAQTTVQEDLVRAASPQPMMPQGMPQQMPQQMAGLQAMQRPQGVAALPSGMDEQSMAGGGIVAFDDGGYVNEEMQYAGGGIVAFAGDKRSDVEDPYADNEYMKRVLRNQEAVSGDFGLGELAKLKNWDPVQSSYRLVKQGIMDPWSRFMKQSPGEQAVAFNAASEARRGDRPMFVNRPEDTARDAAAVEEARRKAAIPTTSEQVKKMMPEESNLKPDKLGRYVAGPNDESKLYEAEALAKKISPKGEALPTVGEKGRMAPTTAETKPGEDMYAKYEEMFKNQAADSKAARQQDKYMRLLEAGLGIMGGTSQHALTNIGQGSMAAAKGYAQDRADYRKEDRQNIMDLMSLGMKKEDAARETEKLAIMRKEAEGKGQYYGAYADFLKSKGANLGNASETAMDKANLAAIGKMHAGLLKEAGKMGSPYYGKSAEELWQLAQGLVLKGGSGAPAPTTVQWNTLGVPPKS